MSRSIDEATDDVDRKVISDVRDYGWHVVIIPDDEEGPGFAFTIGLASTFEHPEVAIVGLPAATMHTMLNTIAELVRAGKRFTRGDRSAEVLEGYDVAFIAVDRAHYDEWLGYAVWFHRGEGFAALQVVWPNRQGKFPWDEGAEAAFVRRQTLLGDAA